MVEEYKTAFKIHCYPLLDSDSDSEIDWSDIDYNDKLEALQPPTLPLQDEVVTVPTIKTQSSTNCDIEDMKNVAESTTTSVETPILIKQNTKKKSNKGRKSRRGTSKKSETSSKSKKKSKKKNKKQKYSNNNQEAVRNDNLPRAGKIL